MNCYNHVELSAVAICASCGRGLCPDCAQEAGSGRIVCSTRCASVLTQSEAALMSIVSQNSRNARASAFYCYLCAGLSAAAAVGAWFFLPSTFLILFTAGCAVVLALSGFWYQRSGRKAPEPAGFVAPASATTLSPVSGPAVAVPKAG